MMSKITSMLIAILGLVPWFFPDLKPENKISITLIAVICGLVVYLVWQEVLKKKNQKGITDNNRINHSSFGSILKEKGIKNIHRLARDNDIREYVKSAKNFYSIAYAGDKFTESHRDELEIAFNNGASIYILVGRRSSDFFEEIDKMEDIPPFEEPSLNPKVNAVISELRRIKDKFPRGRGRIELREFHTEFRNALIMCDNGDRGITAWLTVMFGYKRAADCMSIEFHDGSGVEDCVAYFKKIWRLHHENVLYDSEKAEGEIYNSPKPYLGESPPAYAKPGDIWLQSINDKISKKVDKALQDIKN